MQRRTFFTASAALALSTGIPALASPDSAPEILLPKSSFDLRVFTAELVAIDSKTGYEEGNNRIIEIFAERFRSIGWSVETPYCSERGKALLATNRPDAKRFDIVFCAHTDTVQPVGSAAKHPFRLVDGIAYGAGVADDKSSLNAVWWVAKDLPAHAGNNPQDGRNAITAMALAIPAIQAVAAKYPGVTINGDLVSGGTAVNTIAAEAEVTFDVRFADNASRDAVLADIEALCRQGFLEGVRAEMVPPGASSAMAETEASRALMALVDGAAASLGQPAPKWLTVGGASDGNLFAEYGAGVVCAMGVVGGQLHDPEKEWSDLRTARDRIRLAQATLLRMATKRGG